MYISFHIFIIFILFVIIIIMYYYLLLILFIILMIIILVSVLLRLVELDSGSVVIDNIDISTLGLFALRLLIIK